MGTDLAQRLRELRHARDLTQPDLADAIGIEQSYLSKLENGKSIPSDEMLTRILEVLEISLDDFLAPMDQPALAQLRQLPSVAGHIKASSQRTASQVQRVNVLLSLLTALGVGLAYAGYANVFFANTIHEYMSRGVILEGESKELFMHPTMSIPHIVTDVKERSRILDAINARLDEVYVISNEYRGEMYNLPVAGGSRTYAYKGPRTIEPIGSKLLLLSGIVLAVFGVVFIVVRRWLSPAPRS